MPTGKWWDYAVRHIPNLLMVYRETPLKIFNTTIHIPEHKSDITRLEAVLTLGIFHWVTWVIIEVLHIFFPKILA